MSKFVFDILACPLCNSKLNLTKDRTQLICRFDKLAFDIQDGIPNMLSNEAKELTQEQLDSLELI
ncbi:MAG: Trm112 family protein [Kangiellaceae bacterium]|jgi:uncharacterized protein YbaR (Trm112 family)|nr:Trm112 family protein [Kangiellaceae bacterium]